MSTNCPPQLQLSIQANATSFKRSFEQFGFDLESPVGGATGTTDSAATSDGRNERNKRARSTISFDSETSSDTSSDTLPSTSSIGSSAVSEGGSISAVPPTSLVEPPRLPTPDIPDVEMPDYPVGENTEAPREVADSGERYRLSLQRFNEFDSEIALLRQSPSSATPPPALPPLRHGLLPNDVAFFRRQNASTSAFSTEFFDESPPARPHSDSESSHTRPHVPQGSHSASELPISPWQVVFQETYPLSPLSLHGINAPASPQPSSPSSPTPAVFRDRLNTALERLRSPSPLVPGLEDSDPELRGAGEDMQDSDEEHDSEESLADELPPTLPPIQTTENIFHSSDELQPQSMGQNLPLDPPTLPPIPTTSAAVSAADGDWHVISERFDEFRGNSVSVLDQEPHLSFANVRDNASPRPFSRSARTPLSSSNNNQPLISTASLGDHPLPSPMLRDLHSWIEERQSPSPTDVHHNQNSTRADDINSMSSIPPTTVADGTERDTSMSNLAPSGSDSTSAGPHHDRLSRMLERIRTGGRAEDWAGQSNRRPWLSHAGSWTNSSAETDILRDLLPWYHSDSTPASSSSSSIPTASPDASRPISTTPALTSNPPLGQLTLDAFWDPIFTNLPEANFTRAPRAASPSATTTPSERHWYSTLQRHEDSAVRSSGIRYGDRQSAPSANAGVRSLPSAAFAAADSPSTFLHSSMLASGNSGRMTDVTDGSGDRDRRASDPAAGLWRPLESREPSLNLYFHSSANPSNSNTNNPPYFSSNTSAFNDSESAWQNHGAMRDTSQRPRLNLDTLQGTDGLSEARVNIQRQLYLLGERQPEPQAEGNEFARRLATLEARRLVARRRAMREMLDESERAHAPRTPVPSSLSNWNGRSLGTSSASPMVAPAPSAPSNTDSEQSASSAIDARRAAMLLRHRHRHPRSYSQTRPGSSNSLVTENASEVRRRADQDELRMTIPISSLVDSDSEEHATDGTDSGNQTRSWETEMLEREQERVERWQVRLEAATRRANSVILGRHRQFHLPNPFPQSPDSSDLMDTSEAAASLNPTSAPPVNHPYHVEAPSLPPPDLGSSFNAGPQSRSTATPWASEQISIDDAMEGMMPTSMPSATLFGVDNADNRREFVRFGRPRPVSTTLPLDLRRLRDHEQLQERHRNQHQMLDERVHPRETRHLYSEPTLLEGRRILSSVTGDYGSFRTGSGIPQTNPTSTPSSFNPLPVSSPTTATSLASASNAPRPSARETRRVSAMDPSGRYTHLDPSNFAAGPFRNTLQHLTNEREGNTASESDSNLARVYMRHPPYIPPLPFDGNSDYPPPSHPRANTTGWRPHGTIHASREEQPDSRTASHEAPRLPTFLPSYLTESILNDRDLPANRRLVSERFGGRPGRIVPRPSDDPSRHPRESASSSGDDQPRLDGVYGLRSAPPMPRHRRIPPRVEDDDDASSAELLTAARGARNPRRGMRGNSGLLGSLTSNRSIGLAWRRGRPIGDFMRDEDFDSSYENLLSLSMQIGDAKPRSTPAEVLAKMEKGLYRDFAKEGTDTRCPICLDDYEPDDSVQKLSNCPHWLHEGCLGQWLQTANTCPVCREPVTTPGNSSPFGHRMPRFRAMPFHLPRRRRDSSPPLPQTAPPPPTSPTTTSPATTTPMTTSTAQTLPSAFSARRDWHAARRLIIEDLEELDDITFHDMPGSNGPPQGSPNRANPGAPWRYRRS